MTEILGDFKPDTKTIRGIFDGTNYYEIPDYQRPYDWGDDEIGQFWDDIFSAFDNKDEYYFLGPIILAQMDEGYLEVIDGQQRLTTLTILFCVLRDFFSKKLDGKDKKLNNKIKNAIQSMVDKKYRLRLITQAQYQIHFEQEILKKVVLSKDTLTKKEKEKPKYKFMNSALILKTKLEECQDKKGINQIREFVQYIFDNVVIISIICSNRISAIKLFQTLNTRGLELSLADLTKSFLLSKIEDNKKRKQFMTSWREIEKIAEDNDETVTDLLTYYTYYLLAVRPKKSLYEELETKLKREDSTKIVHQFNIFAENYNEILDSKLKVIYSLRFLPDKVFWKTILLAAKMNNYHNFKDLCYELRKLYYSYWIANYTTAKTRDFSFKLISMIKKDESISKIRNEINKKFKEDNVFKWVKESLEYDAYGNSWVKPLLVLVECSQTDESVYIEYGKNLHIDHILPEKWENKKYWKENWSKESVDYWLNKIGNLTLLSGIKNIRASNNEFSVKKTIYKGKGIDGLTSFEITKKIIKDSDWTEKEVRKRQKWLIEETKKNLNIKF